MLANYHTHTARCRHASGTERDYIETAISRGLKVLGFSDHTPQLFPAGYYSNYRMFPEEFDNYVKVLSDLKREYRDDIELHIGVEAEYYPAVFGDLLDFFADYPLEYMILGQHFMDSEFDTRIYSGALTKDEARLEKYAKQVTEAIGTGHFTYVAHPDLIRYDGPDEIYEKHMRPFCERAKELDIPMELNFLGLTDGRAYPNARFWKLAAEVGNTAIYGCDAHQPDAVASERGLALAEEYRTRFGLNVTEAPVFRR